MKSNPAAITKIHLNACAFTDAGLSRAFAAAAPHFPNAEHTYSYFHEVEHPDVDLPVVLFIEPELWGDDEERKAVFEAVETIVKPFIQTSEAYTDDEAWQPDPGGWKAAD